MSDLKSLAELWHRRAGVADSAAEELSRLAHAVDLTLRRNNLGSGCTEGEHLHSKLTGTIRAVHDELRTMAEDARALASNSSGAADKYAEADRAGALGVAE